MMLYYNFHRLLAMVNRGDFDGLILFVFLNRIFDKHVTFIGYNNSNCYQSWWNICSNNMVFMVLLSKTITRIIWSKYCLSNIQSKLNIFQEFLSNIFFFYIQSAFVTDIMNSGLMLCIEPDWMDTLYDVHFEQFYLFEDLSEPFKIVLHQMLIGIEINRMKNFVSLFV